MQRIDSHQHFWLLRRGDYDWLTPDCGSIYRDFLPQDLIPLLQASDIDGTILVQAAPTPEETEYLLALANEYSFIKGVVGWVNFESAGGVDKITELAAHSSVVGLRPMIQDIEDDGWMLKDTLEPAFQALIRGKLCFDALVAPRHLVNLNIVVTRYPQLRVIIDHAAKPDIFNQDFSRWSEQITLLAQHPTVFCKLSGLVTEAGNNWDIDKLRPYVDHIIRVFGTQRVMWGSDWPVCTLAASYISWCKSTQDLLSELSAKERSYIMGGTATHVYRLRPQHKVASAARIT